MAAREHYAVQVASEASTTSSTAWTTAATLNFIPVSGRDYVLLWSLELTNYTTRMSDAKFRIAVDGLVVVASNVEMRDTDEYPSFSGFFKITGAGAAKAVTLEIQAETATHVIAARNVRLVALALGASDQFAEVIGRQDVTSSTFGDLASVTFSPPSAGNYLFLSSSLIDNYATTVPAYGRFDVGTTSGEFAMAVAEIASGQMNLAPMFGAWVANLTTGSKTLKWQGRSHLNAQNSGWTDVRILALRLDAFDAATFDTLGSDSSSTSASATSVLSLPASTSANPHLVFGYWSVGGSGSNIPGYVEVYDDLGMLAESTRRTFATGVARGAGAGFVALRTGYGASATINLDRASDGVGTYTVGAGALLVALNLGSAGRTLSVDPRALVLSGKAVTPRVTRKLTAARRTFAVAGINTSVRKGYRARVDVRGYGVTGRATGVARGLKLGASKAPFSLAGVAVSFSRTVAGRAVSVATAAYVLGQGVVGLRATRKLPVAREAYVWSRLNVGLSLTRRITVDPGGYALGSGFIGWGWTHVLRVAPAPLTLTLPSIALRYSGGRGWQPAPGTTEAWGAQTGAAEIWAPASDIAEVWS